MKTLLYAIAALLILLSSCTSATPTVKKKLPVKDEQTQQYQEEKANARQETATQTGDTEDKTAKKVRVVVVAPDPRIDPDPYPYPDPILPDPIYPTDPISPPHPKETLPETPLTVAEEMPEFPGGSSAMLKFMQTNLNYPPEAMELGIEGKVYVRFVVNADGSLRDFKVLKSPYPSLEKEALRMLKTMPNWKPAKNQGKAVDCYVNVPVSFRLD